MCLTMAIRTLCLLLVTLLALTTGSEFLAADRTSKVQLASVREELRAVLSDVLGSGHGVKSARLAHIRAVLTPLFRSLPKTRQGHLSAPVMRYAVQRYFSQQRGWTIKGFEPHAGSENASAFTDGEHILQNRIPTLIRTMLEQKLSHGGFALEDAAVMVAAIERLILNEVIRGVEVSYDLNLLETSRSVSQEALMEVLSSYLITEMLDGSASNITLHRSDKANIRDIYPHWDATYELLLDISKNDGYEHKSSQNPFSDTVISFEDVARISQRVSEEFGPLTNHECNVMHSSLSGKDPHGTGRVRLSDFYKRSADSSWQFEEAAEYLRQLGAMDDSSSLLGPQVIIPNYITGMSNCITSTQYYSICCLNRCDDVYQHLEASILSSDASPTEILSIVDDMLRSTEANNMSSSLRLRLEDVASQHDGKVPLHGRLLAQWLHFVFPRDCPYPHMPGTVSPLAPAQYEKNAGTGSTAVTPDEVEEYLKAQSARGAPSPEAGASMWNDQEVLLDTQTAAADVSGVARSLLRIVAVIGMFAGLSVFALKEASRVLGIVQPEGKKSAQFTV